MKCLFSAVLFFVAHLSLRAEIKMASIFTDNMVLQQQSNAPLWGWASPGQTVRVIPSWDQKSYSVKANAAGRWKIEIATPVAGGPYQISLSDGQPLKLNNVLIGEVWLCSGQSNMEMPMKGFKGQPVYGANDAILKSRNKNIRIYTVPRSSFTEPQQDSKPSAWKQAEPEAVSNFSATAYYFARLLNEMLDVPVGVINSSYGGSSIEAWMNPETLKSFKDIKVPAKNDPIVQKSRTPTTLYNGMIYPIIGYGIKGCIWYQGESNYERPDQYEQLFPALVNQWRKQWGAGEFPFYYAQIAPFNYTQLPPYYMGGKYNSAYLRDAQRKSAAAIPNSAMAVLLDIGEENCIHPMNKEVGGRRLALLALAKTYGMKGFGAASPEFASAEVKGSIMVLKFNNASNGFTSYGKKLSLFEVAGEDKVFHPAEAMVGGSSISVSSPYVSQPVHVRYAFKDFVIGDLYSTEGLPVSSFRSDSW